MQEKKELPKLTVFAIIILLLGVLGSVGTLQSLLLAVGIVLNPDTNPTGVNVYHLIVMDVFSGVFSISMTACGVGLLNRKWWAAKFLLYTIIIQIVVALINLIYSYMENKPIKTLIIAFGIALIINGIIGCYLWLKIFKVQKKKAPEQPY